MKNKKTYRLFAIMMILFMNIGLAIAQKSPQWVVYQGNEGPGKGKHIVFVSGDE